MSDHDLTIDRLRRMQATLLRRVTARDPGNIRSVGFAPADAAKAASAEGDVLPLTAQFDVGRKLADVPQEKRIQRLEGLRLLDRDARHYRSLAIVTDVRDVRDVGDVVPTGVRVTHAGADATSSVLVRWTSINPPHPPPTDPDPDDLRWSWGTLTVSHLFSGEPARQRVGLERKVVCAGTPQEVGGRLETRGRIPGGPDVAVIETGLDRLWLSGFLKRSDSPPVATADDEDVIRWTTRGVGGTLLADGASHRWEWETFYPRLHIGGLGELEHVIRYRYRGTGGSASQPFGPGASGSVLVAGGIPIGIQIAAAKPDFTIGYAQSFTASLPWLRSRLKATELSVVAVVG